LGYEFRKCLCLLRLILISDVACCLFAVVRVDVVVRLVWMIGVGRKSSFGLSVVLNFLLVCCFVLSMV